MSVSISQQVNELLKQEKANKSKFITMLLKKHIIQLNKVKHQNEDGKTKNK